MSGVLTLDTSRSAITWSSWPARSSDGLTDSRVIRYKVRYAPLIVELNIKPANPRPSERFTGTFKVSGGRPPYTVSNIRITKPGFPGTRAVTSTPMG